MRHTRLIVLFAALLLGACGGAQQADQPAAPPPPRAATPPPAAHPADTAGTSEPVRIVIEDIGLDGRMVSVGLDENRIPVVPKHNVGWYNLSAQPGQGENIVLWGHVLRF